MFLIVSASYAGENNNEASSANKASIKGKIIDKTSKEELVCAIVEVEGTDIKVCTDMNGDFTLDNLKPGNYTLNIKYISYQETLVENIKVKENKTKNLSIRLDRISL
jgi:hypothetical protein